MIIIPHIKQSLRESGGSRLRLNLKTEFMNL